MLLVINEINSVFFKLYIKETWNYKLEKECN